MHDSFRLVGLCVILDDMLLSPHIKTRQLVWLSRRLAMALDAGVDIRAVWAREAQRATGRAVREQYEIVAQAIDRGSPLAGALSATGDFFPALFRELVAVGEETGRLGEVFGQLADHYQSRMELRRGFLSVVAWPLIQLALCLLIVGFLIWVMGFIQRFSGSDVDPLGFGLVGNSGLLVYCLVLTAIGLPLALLIYASRRGLVWTRPIQRSVLRLPVVGKALQTLALARMAWSLHLTMGTGMDVRRAMRLSLRSTNNARYTDRAEQIERDIENGQSIHAALANTEAFPLEFLDHLAVAEESGQLAESMDRLAQQYHEHARTALAALAKSGGLAIWLVIVTVIVFLIFRLAASYVGMINNAIPG